MFEFHVILNTPPPHSSDLFKFPHNIHLSFPPSCTAESIQAAPISKKYMVIGRSGFMEMGPSSLMNTLLGLQDAVFLFFSESQTWTSHLGPSKMSITKCMETDKELERTSIGGCIFVLI